LESMETTHAQVKRLAIPFPEYEPCPFQGHTLKVKHCKVSF